MATGTRLQRGRNGKGRLLPDGTVVQDFNGRELPVGSVTPDGGVYDGGGHPQGRVDGGGTVYDSQGNPVGMVDSGGVTYSGRRRVGRVYGAERLAGGAATILLLEDQEPSVRRSGGSSGDGYGEEDGELATLIRIGFFLILAGAALTAVVMVAITLAVTAVIWGGMILAAFIAAGQLGPRLAAAVDQEAAVGMPTAQIMIRRRPRTVIAPQALRAFLLPHPHLSLVMAPALAWGILSITALTVFTQITGGAQTDAFSGAILAVAFAVGTFGAYRIGRNNLQKTLNEALLQRAAGAVPAAALCNPPQGGWNLLANRCGLALLGTAAVCGAMTFLTIPQGATRTGRTGTPSTPPLLAAAPSGGGRGNYHQGVGSPESGANQVRSQIQDAIGQSEVAFRREDVDGMFAYTTPDWRFVASDRRPDTREDSMRYYRALFMNRATAAPGSLTTSLKKRILSVTGEGPDIRTVVVSVEANRADGVSRRFTQEETWVHTSEGWRCKEERRMSVSPPSASSSDSLASTLRSRPLTDSDLAGQTAFELDVLRNEPFARHGFRFTKRADLATHFARQAWYRPETTNDSAVYNRLSATERRNVIFVREYQRARNLLPLKTP